MNTSKLSLTMISAIAVALTLPVVAGENTPSGLTVVAANPLDQAADKQEHTFEIRINNGEVTVKRDGKAIPKEHVIRGDGRIVITDENGDQLKDFVFELDDADSVLHAFQGEGGQFMGQLADLGKIYAGADGKEPKVILGLQMGETGPALEKHLGLEAGTTTMITAVYEGLPAHQAGLAQYDIITQIEGKKPASREAIREVLAAKEPGDTVTLKVIQSGTPREVKVKILAYDRKAMESAKLLGDPVQQMIWRQLGDQGFWNQSGLAPLLEGQRILVAPEKNQGRIEFYTPQAPRAEGRDDGDERDREGVQDTLDRLDKRMAELEKLLQKLADRPR